MRNWLLPENIQDVLPPEARRIEILRARLLELFRVHGYQLVAPPLPLTGWEWFKEKVQDLFR